MAFRREDASPHEAAESHGAKRKRTPREAPSQSVVASPEPPSEVSRWTYPRVPLQPVLSCSPESRPRNTRPPYTLKVDEKWDEADEEWEDPPAAEAEANKEWEDPPTADEEWPTTSAPALVVALSVWGLPVHNLPSDPKDITIALATPQGDAVSCAFEARDGRWCARPPSSDSYRVCVKARGFVDAKTDVAVKSGETIAPIVLIPRCYEMCMFNYSLRVLDGCITGVELVQIAHHVVTAKLREHKLERLDCEKIYHIHGGVDWLKLAGCLQSINSTMRRISQNSETDYFSTNKKILVGEPAIQVDVVDEAEYNPLHPRVKYGVGDTGRDLSYANIVRLFTALKTGSPRGLMGGS